MTDESITRLSAREIAARVRAREVTASEAVEAHLAVIARDNPTIAQAGDGFTLEGQGMVLSAPGTEWFKQDFGEWDQLRDGW